MAPVVKELGRLQSVFNSKVCVTAQHRKMLDGVLELFEIVPDYDLDIMAPNQTLTGVTCNVLRGLEPVLADFRPDIVLVHGDTTTTLAASLASFYQKISVGHVEAGLRTGNMYSPWPEEMNRRLAGAIAQHHFAPTAQAKANLIREGVGSDAIEVTGNTGIDALLTTVKRLRSDAQILEQARQHFSFLDPLKRLILVTGHRRENFGEGFISISNALKGISEARTDVEIIYPVHLNPNVLDPVRRILGEVTRIHLVEPQEYLQFVYLMDRCHFIITDSGGVQEEACSLGKPVLVMRDTTERPEAVDAGTARLVGSNPEKITEESIALLSNDALYQSMSVAKNIFGDGNAAVRIAKFLS